MLKLRKRYDKKKFRIMKTHKNPITVTTIYKKNLPSFFRVEYNYSLYLIIYDLL